MNRFDRDLSAIRELMAERKAKGKTREDYPDGIERDAYDVWQFLMAQAEMPGYEEAAADYTYEEVLASLIEHDEY